MKKMLMTCCRNHPADPEWPFEDPPNLATFTTCHVTERGSHIVFASREVEDGAWVFLGPEEWAPEDGTVRCFQCMVEADPTLKALADLPLGWYAERPSPRTAWRRFKAR